MSTKFIPNADLDFKTMAQTFARIITHEPGRFAVSQDDADMLSDAVERYAAAYEKSKFGSSRSPATTMEKNTARKEAEQIIRRLARAIRANEDIDEQVKLLLKLRARTSQPKRRSVPMEPPGLRFVKAVHEANTAMPMHELKFRAMNGSKPKATGAVRLELFVDLVPPDEPIPTHPGANLSSRPWYLRSFTRSPIVLSPPMMDMPMRVVYWGRWADSSGNVGPFSQTVVARVEGGSHHKMLPQFESRHKPTMVPPAFSRMLPASATEHSVQAPDFATHIESVVRGHLCADTPESDGSSAQYWNAV